MNIFCLFEQARSVYSDKIEMQLIYYFVALAIKCCLAAKDILPAISGKSLSQNAI